ncbi:unnamed protein product [Acanthoscelides obtectus]|uniref:26S proteasome non-ATPase regulatory subunit 10 n=1 Tax=Acanthoscelides obtectus TaxID=200917 RepID=A0A9P0LCT2_ACAOB|nr:unnamed protein product [Acanthoscelides obtectus]CAK1637585.1 26S proteasome non-ATPase regulatory subunit 10 [Acanthoscelides obtectus]
MFCKVPSMRPFGTIFNFGHKDLDLNQRLLFHWAVLSGNVKLVTYLIDLGIPINPVDDTDTTPLILASSAGRTEIVKMILDRCDDVNHKTSQGHSALQYAASKGWTEICKYLLDKGANINITDMRGSTPLHRAASKGNIQVLNLFLSDYADDLNINVKDIYGNTPLHLACEEDRQEEATLLVEHGADIEIKNRDQQTPLDLCTPKLARLLKSKAKSA